MNYSLEQIEIAAWRDFYLAAVELPNNPLDIRVVDLDDAIATVFPSSNVLAMNRVIGLGTKRPISADSLKRIIDIYHQAGVSRFFVQLHPATLTSEATAVLAECDLQHYNNWVKLSRPAEPLKRVTTELTVKEIGPDEAEPFARIVGDSFGWDEPFLIWGKALVGRSGWRFYMAYDGDEPVATGGFYLADKIAWIDFAATKETHRGRGAQSALLKRRIDDAISMGCEQLVVETAEQTSEKEAPSYRNMIRYGFTEAYVRPNYIYEFEE